MSGTKVVIVGNLLRCAPLAGRLYERMVRDSGLRDCMRLDLHIKPYIDHLTLLYPETRLTENPTHATMDLGGNTHAVMDDTMDHGHSMLRAVEHLGGKQPTEISTLVLGDRGQA
jgi:pyrimidine operon attenuation protein / uracil phosphoribosyltransferase